MIERTTKVLMKRVFFDMDNVLVDFASGIARLDANTIEEFAGSLDEVPGIFALMDPMPGAAKAARRLAEKYECSFFQPETWRRLFRRGVDSVRQQAVPGLGCRIGVFAGGGTRLKNQGRYDGEVVRDERNPIFFPDDVIFRTVGKA